MGVFGTMRSLDVRSLAGPAVEFRALPGETLVDEGTTIGKFFVIRSGCAELWRGGARVGSLRPGDGFGEIDPVAPTPQAHTVIAASPIRLLAFSALGIDTLCATIPYVREEILSVRAGLPLSAGQPLSSAT